LHKGFILDLLTDDKKAQIILYRRFVAVADDKEFENVMARTKWPSLLGPQEFIDWVKATYSDKKGRDEMPQMRELFPDTDKIISMVCDFYDIARKDLFTSQRGIFNEPRCVAIYLLRRLRHDSLKEIGKLFNLEKNSSVSSILGRMKTRIKISHQIKMRVKKIEYEVRKS